MADVTTRPTPLRDAARVWSLVAGGIGALATFLLTNNVLTAGQVEAISTGTASINLLLSAVVAVITAGTGIVGAFATAKQGESKVTPVEAPHNNNGVPLVPANPVGL